MARTFVSWIGACTTVQPDHAAGKLAAIWFDQIIYEVPRADFFSRLIPTLVDQNRLPASLATELGTIWLPVQHFLPHYEMSCDAWDTSDRRLATATAKVLTERMELLYPGADEYAKRREVALAGAGTIRAVTTWSALHSYNACNFWASEIESAAVNEAFLPQQDAGGQLFGRIMSGRVPNLDSMPWERVLELRHHPRLEDFRRRLTALFEENRQRDLRDVSDMVDEIERRDMIEIAKICEPSPTSATVKGIASNFPMTTPVNPISAAFAVRDIALAQQMKKRFGWLYFLIDLESNPTRLI